MINRKHWMLLGDYQGRLLDLFLAELMCQYASTYSPGGARQRLDEGTEFEKPWLHPDQLRAIAEVRQAQSALTEEQLDQVTPGMLGLVFEVWSRLNTLFCQSAPKKVEVPFLGDSPSEF
jgi:hypothetical protein